MNVLNIFSIYLFHLLKFIKFSFFFKKEKFKKKINQIFFNLINVQKTKIKLEMSNSTKIFFSFMPIADYQVFIALFLALATGIFAVRLGVALYK